MTVHLLKKLIGNLRAFSKPVAIPPVAVSPARKTDEAPPSPARVKPPARAAVP
jgi:hypothetical protein